MNRSQHPTETPRFTIVMAAYDAAATIARSIVSVLGQSIGDWRLVIVDDGSSDDTLLVAREFAGRDVRIRVLHQDNAGAGPARDLAIRQSASEFIVVLDADDQISSGYLETMGGLASRHPEFAVYACNASIEYPDGSRRTMYGSQRQRLREITLLDEIASSELPFSLIRRYAYEDVGGYRAMFAEDYDLMLRLLASGGRAVRSVDKLATYTVSAGNKSANHHAQSSSTRDAVADLLQRGNLSASARRACEKRIRSLDDHIALIPIKQRIRSGAYAGVRRAFVTHRRSMPPLRRVVVVSLVLVSPRVYRRLVLGIDPMA